MSVGTEEQLTSEAAKPEKIDMTILDRREFEYQDGPDTVKLDIDFLVIDKPEKWRPAAEISSSFEVSTINAKKSYRFKLHGISYKDYEGIELRNIIPPPPQDSNGNEVLDDKSYDAEVQRIAFVRKIEVIELSTQLKIPGNTPQEKEIFLKQRCGGEIETLFLYIWENMMCQGDGELMARYNKAIESGGASKECVELTSFDEWDTAEMNTSRFMFQHRSEKCICEIPLKLVSAADSEKIEHDAKMPMAPLAPKTSGGKRTGEMYRNVNDQHYKTKIREAVRRRNIMLLESSLPFAIPGTNQTQRTAWVMDRPVGDVARLLNFIENEVLGYGSRLDFFTRG